MRRNNEVEEYSSNGPPGGGGLNRRPVALQLGNSVPCVCRGLSSFRFGSGSRRVVCSALLRLDEGGSQCAEAVKASESPQATHRWTGP